MNIPYIAEFTFKTEDLFSSPLNNTMYYILQQMSSHTQFLFVLLKVHLINLVCKTISLGSTCNFFGGTTFPLKDYFIVAHDLVGWAILCLPALFFSD